MILDEIAPFKICVNLSHRQDRREQAWSQFDQLGMSVIRFPAISAHRVKSTWGYRKPSRYACSLSKRLAIRCGKLSGASAVLLMEDDVVLAADLHERLECIELPEDWGILFLGCKHLEPPMVNSPGLVRVTRAADHHAMIIRREFIGKVLLGLAGISKHASPEIPFSDVKMSDIQKEIPTYACYPNLAWQQLNHSDNAGRTLSYYSDRGKQLTIKQAIEALENEVYLSGTHKWPTLPYPVMAQRSEMQSKNAVTTETVAAEIVHQARITGPMRSPLKIPAWQFLINVPKEKEFAMRYPLAFCINLARREDRRMEAEYQFVLQGIAVERLPAVNGLHARNIRGHINGRTYACSLSHRMAIRKAKQRKSPCVLIFEDDVVLHPYFRDILERLEPPSDWGILFLGATHVQSPQVICPGWVKIKYLWGTQAYILKSDWYDTVLHALRQQDRPSEELGCDDVLSLLSDTIPMYATYPNIAWQAESYSDLMGKDRAAYSQDGQQSRLIPVVSDVNESMRHCIACEYGDDVVDEKKHPYLQPRDVFQAGSPKWTLEQEFSLRLCLNLPERSDRRQQASEQFAKIDLVVEFFAAIGCRRRKGISKPDMHGRALSHILALRRAWRSGVEAVLLFEDDIVIHKNLRLWAQAIELPSNWGILYLGNQYTHPPNIEKRGMIRVSGGRLSHAYAVRRKWIPTITKLLRDQLKNGNDFDMDLTELEDSIPTYGFYPNLTWQRHNHSSNQDKESSKFESDGVQKMYRNVIDQVDHDMKSLITHQYNA